MRRLMQVFIVAHVDTCANSCNQFFDFHTTLLEHTLVLPASAASILLHRDSSLLAVICEDQVIRIVDIETRRIVRELRGFNGRILDMVCLLCPFKYVALS